MTTRAFFRQLRAEQHQQDPLWLQLVRLKVDLLTWEAYFPTVPRYMRTLVWNPETQRQFALDDFFRWCALLQAIFELEQALGRRPSRISDLPRLLL